MLGKVFKYDSKYMMRGMLWYYLVLVLTGCLIRISGKLGENWKVFTYFSVFATVIFIIGLVLCFVYTGFLVIWRYYRYTFRDEAYLMHTLPVKRSFHLCSKILVFGLFLLFDILAVIISLLAAGGSQENIQAIWDGINTISTIVEVPVWGGILLVAAFLILCLMNYMLMIMAGIAVGHGMSSRKNIMSVVFCIVFYYAQQILYLVGLAVGILSNGNLIEEMNRAVPTASALGYIFGIIGVVIVISITVYYLVSNYVITRKLNLE